MSAMDDQASRATPQSFRSLSTSEKLYALTGILLVLLSLASIGATAVLGLLGIWLLIPNTYWLGCFMGSVASLVGWVVFYAVQLWFGGGMMLFRSNFILIWTVIAASLFSCFRSFSGRQLLIVFALLLALIGSLYFVFPLLRNSFDIIFRPKRVLEKHRQAMRRIQFPRSPSGTA